ncbi:MAG: hypothetical protein P8M50_01230 [Paracoccaceae bacterium]|nr:hypothetical protein [Paracoccaceae bacterium]
MNELTYLTESEKIDVLEETIPRIGKLQAEIQITKQKVKQLNEDEANLKKIRELVVKDMS